MYKYILLLCLFLCGCSQPLCVGIQQHNEVYDESYVMVCEDKGKRTYEGTIYDQKALDEEFDTFKLWVEQGQPPSMRIER